MKKQIHKIFLLVTLLSLVVAQIGSAGVIFKPLNSIEDSLKVIKQTEYNHILFFFDSLDVNTDRAMGLLKNMDTQKKDLLIYSVDCRENYTAWLRSCFRVSYFPSLIFFHKLSHGSRKIENFNPFVVKPQELL
ncbi:unnamed protein product [Phytomonas sp. EM1]|nr:unnamed protein product [Phytomonas sp. EM1]|eukprot:CCW63548.1 unnamed protein product [Phytomonas sp. isolate EM1]